MVPNNNNDNNSRYHLDPRHTKCPLTPLRFPMPFAFLGKPSLQHLFFSLITLTPATMVEELELEMDIVWGCYLCIVLRLLKSGRRHRGRVRQLFFQIRSVFLVAHVALARWVSVRVATCFNAMAVQLCRHPACKFKICWQSKPWPKKSG